MAGPNPVRSSLTRSGLTVKFITSLGSVIPTVVSDLASDTRCGTSPVDCTDHGSTGAWPGLTPVAMCDLCGVSHVREMESISDRALTGRSAFPVMGRSEPVVGVAHLITRGRPLGLA